MATRREGLGPTTHGPSTHQARVDDVRAGAAALTLPESGSLPTVLGHCIELVQQSDWTVEPDAGPHRHQCDAQRRAAPKDGEGRLDD